VDLPLTLTDKAQGPARSPGRRFDEPNIISGTGGEARQGRGWVLRHSHAKYAVFYQASDG